MSTRVVVVVAALALVVGCAENKPKPDEGVATDAADTSSSDDAAKAAGTESELSKADGPQTPPPLPADKPAEDPAKPAAPTEAPKLSDKIDDEHPLPQSGPAFDAFRNAVDTAKTDPAGAVSRFVDAANKAPYFYAAWFNAGSAAEDAGDLAAAEKHYKQALQVRPDYGLALTNLAALLVRTNRAAEAERLVADALKKFPERSGPHLAAATLAWNKKDVAAAEKESLLALKYDERNVPAMRLMAMVFRSQGRVDTAQFAIKNALKLEPGNAVLHVELGQAFLDQKEEKQALVEFEKAARLKPTLTAAQENYGVLLLKYGFAQEAVRAFEACVQQEPKSGRAQLHLGNGKRAVKDYAGAEAAYRKALELDPSLLDAHFNLGLLYIDNALPGDELERLKKGLAELKEYQTRGKPEGAVQKRLNDYIDATDKRIVKETKRRERDERRRKDEEKDKAKGAGNPAEGNAVSSNGGKQP